MGKQLDITRREFQRSFKSHYNLYCKTVPTNSPRTRRLILFYCVECGLKSFIMRSIGKDTYEELKKYSEDNQKRIHGHDLKAMMLEIGIEQKYPLKKIRLKEGGDVTPDRYNELWRYGAETDNEMEEIKAEQNLLAIAEWILKRL